MEVGVTTTKTDRVFTKKTTNYWIKVPGTEIGEISLNIEFAARKPVARADHRVRLRDHIAVGVIHNVVQHDAAVIHEIAYRPQMIGQVPPHGAGAVFLGEYLIDCWAMQVALGQHRRVRAGAIAI